MIHGIPFAVPAKFSADMANGAVYRIGALLKEQGTGKIVAHVQETGMAQQVLSGLMGFPFSPLNTLNLASTAYTNVQLNQLKIMVEGLQILQYANLGVAIAGIGVSVAGFAMITSRLKGIEGQITHLAESMRQSFQDLFDRELRSHFSHVYVLFEKAETAGALSNPTNELVSVASQLTDESGFFRNEIIHLLEQKQFDADLFTSLVRSLALCNAGRVECLLLANELTAAHCAADMIGRHYRDLFDDLVPTYLATKQIARPNEQNKTSYSRLREEQPKMKYLVQGLRDVTEAALTKPLLIESLMEQKINGRDYIMSLRNEKQHPLLLLEHIAA